MTAETAAPRSLRLAPFERAWAVSVPLAWEISFYTGVFLVAFGLRFWDLGSRALHHDESIHAQWSWNLLDYHHSPVFHGPFYYHVQGLVFFLFGASDYTARVSAAAFGLGMVVLPLLLRRRLGAVGTGATVLFIAFSPTLVYYSRFFREDIYMAFFTLLMAVAMWRYMEEGRDRWLATFALAFTGAMTTKEGAFLVVASFLVYLDVYLAAQLANQTLSTRELNTPLRRFVLAGACAPWAWAIAAGWPFLGRLRRSMDWQPTLPRSGDMLVLLGTFTLVLLTPAARHYVLEPLGLLEVDRLNWEKNLQGSVSRQDGMAIAGIFAMTISAAAFVGLQWRPRLWATLFGVCAFIYLTLMTSFWNNLDGLVSGPWGSLDYWITQQDVSRGDQPWFYYDMLMPVYEFLPLAIAIGGAWWSLVRGDAFSRFLWVWLVGMWFGLSYGAEKMPWLNTHLALPTAVLAGWTVGRAWSAWEPKPRVNRAAMALVGSGAIAMGALALIVFMPGGPAYDAVRVMVAVVGVSVVAYTARPFGRPASAAFLLAGVIGALGLFSVTSMVQVSFERGDVPQDMLIYTQSSPAIPDIMADIDRLAAVTGKGHQLAIAVDSSDSFSWPWAWYLRDYKRVSYIDFRNQVPQGDFDVMLVNQTNIGRVNDALAARTSVQFGSPQRYPHRWWFNEQYKDAMAIDDGACTHQSGNCGPMRLATWEHIFSRVPGWLDTWYTYWRDHSADEIFGGSGESSRCRSCGSVDAWAFFPANFDRQRGMLTARPLEPPKPTTDESGRPVFGGIGSLPGQFSQPVDIESDASGDLYVIDWATKKLQKFDANGNFLAAVSVRRDPSNLNEAAEPWGLGIGPNGEVAVADTFGWRVRIFDSDLRDTGIQFGEPPTDAANPGPYSLFGPRDVAFDPEGNLWVTDTGHARIQVYSPEGEYIRTIGSRGSGTGEFDEPVGVTFSADGVAFVADMYNSRVVMLDSSGAPLGQFKVDGWGGREVSNKPYLEPLSDGRVAVSLPNSNEVRIYSRDGTVTGRISISDDPVKQPYGILETADAKLWIVEGGSGRVRQFTAP